MVQLKIDKTSLIREYHLLCLSPTKPVAPVLPWSQFLPLLGPRKYCFISSIVLVCTFSFLPARPKSKPSTRTSHPYSRMDYPIYIGPLAQNTSRIHRGTDTQGGNLRETKAFQLFNHCGFPKLMPRHGAKDGFETVELGSRLEKQETEPPRT